MPAFPSMRKHRIDLASVELTPEILEAADAVVVVTHHDAIDWSLVGRHARLVVDTRNAMSRADEIRGRLVKA